MARVLFLPGFMQNGVRLARTAQELETGLKNLGVTIDYVDPPIKIASRDQVYYPLGANAAEADKKWQSVVERDFNRCWWDYRGRDAYLGFDESLNWIINYIKENGPYDGIMGFSQGSSMAAILTNSINRLLPQHGNFKFSIFISGLAFTEPIDKSKPDVNQAEDINEYIANVKLKSKFATYFTRPENLETKVVVVYGTSDPVLPPLRTQYLASIYQPHVTIIEFVGGHYVPKEKQVIDKIVKAIKPVVQSKSNL